jgi:hypothetical protein
MPPPSKYGDIPGQKLYEHEYTFFSLILLLLLSSSSSSSS